MDKKKHIISYQNLSDDLQELFHEEYEEGYTDYIQRISKPDGSPLFVVPLETDDSYYLVKIEVKVDEKLSEEELDKQLFAGQKDDEDDTGDDTFDDTEGATKGGAPFELKHGEYADVDLTEDDKDEDDYGDKPEDDNDSEEDDDED